MGRPLLLHVCCAPCSAGTVARLNELFSVSLFFSNDNIHPAGEYERRLAAARVVADWAGVPLRVPPYRPGDWLTRVEGLADEPEGGERCGVCFSYRLEETARYARDYGFPIFGTTLTISPHKDHTRVNRLGAEAAERHGVLFLRCDLKKNDGFGTSVKISRELDLYRQDYCGCCFSRGAAEARPPEPS